jgi:hypothetical protein
MIFPGISRLFHNNQVKQKCFPMMRIFYWKMVDGCQSVDIIILLLRVEIFFDSPQSSAVIILDEVHGLPRDSNMAEVIDHNLSAPLRNVFPFFRIVKIILNLVQQIILAVE